MDNSYFCKEPFNIPMLKLVADPETVLSYKNAKHAEQLLRLVNRNRAYLRSWLKWVDDTIELEDILGFMEQGNVSNIYEPTFAMEIWYRNELSGIIGFNRGNATTGTISIGYWLSEELQGRGIVTRSCRRMINFAFEDSDLKEMYLLAGTDNKKSQNIAERLGFEYLGIDAESQIIDGKKVEMASFKLTRERWHEKLEIYSK